MAIINKQDIITTDAVKALDPLIAQYEKLNEQQKKLIAESKAYQQILTNIKKTNDGSEAQKLVQINTQLVKTNQDLISVESKRKKVTAEMKVQQQELNRIEKQEATIKNQLVGEYKRQSTLLNKLRTDYKNLAVQEKANTKEAKQLLKQITALGNKLKKVDATVGQHQRNVGNYGSALKGLGKKILGAAGIVSGVDLLIEGFTKLIDRSRELDKLTRKINNIFDVTTKKAKSLSASILSLANNFGEDYNEILQAANAVSKEFGITADNALALIEEGFKKGSNNSGEFLDILKEYPAQLQSVGLSAEESFAIINQQVRAGVYSDKGIDAIKEAGIALRENTKAVQDALKPLDANVRAEIEREVAAGNTFKAMQLISKELNNTNLTAAQTQAIMSDVFKGAGEDSLTFIKNLDKVQLTLDGVKNQTSQVEEANLALSETWNSFVGGISDSDSIFSKVWANFLGSIAHAIKLGEEFLKLIGLIKQEGTKLNDNEKQLTVTRKAGEKNAEEREAAENKLTTSKKELNNEYQKEIDNLDAYTQKLQKTRREEIALLAAEIERRNLLRQKEGETPEISTFGVGVTDTFDPIAGLKEQQKQAAKLEDKKRQEDLKKEIEQQQAIADLKQTFQNEAINYAKNATDSIVENQLNRQLASLQAQEDALKINFEKGLLTEQQYADQLAEIQKKRRIAEARAERRKALYDIAINTAVAVVKSLGGVGGFIRAALVAAAGAVQAAFVATTPLPKFEKGGWHKGKLHSQGGEVVEVERDEFTVNRHAAMQSPTLLEAINNGMLRDKDLGLRKGQKDNLLLGVMMQNNNYSKQMVNALSNLRSSYSANGIVTERDTEGRISYHIDHSQDEFIKKLAYYLKQK